MKTLRNALVSTAFLLLLSWSGQAQSIGASIGVSFLGDGGNPEDRRLAPADTAGVVAQSNWNNINSTSSGNVGVSDPLLDNAGNLTAVQLQFVANDAWNSDGITDTPNDKLMKGIIKQGGADSSMTLNFLNLTQAFYDLYVYGNVNGGPVDLDVSTGATTNYWSEPASYDAGTGFIQASSADPGTRAEGNYVKFIGLTPIGGSITVTATYRSGSDGLGIAGLQLASSAAFPTNATPSITTQPVNQTNGCGSTASFNVVAAGSPPLSYFWTANGFPVAPDATNATLTVTNVLADSLVQVRVVVTNLFGAVASEPATLTVTNQMTTLSLVPTITSNVYALSWPADTCVPPMLHSVNYAVANQTNWAAVIPTNATVTATSNIVNVPATGVETVYTLSDRSPIISNSLPAQSLSTSIGSNVTFTVIAANRPSMPNSLLFYDWRLNGTRLPGATNATLTLTNVQRTDGGSYRVVVGNGVDAVTSDAATLTMGGTALALTNVFASRIVVSDLTNAVNGNNVGATKEPFEPNHAGALGGKSVWLGWKAPETGIATFDTKGSAFDTVLAVYTNTIVSDLVIVASDDDRGGFYTSQVQFNAVAGTEYEIVIDGFAGDSGNIALNWTLEVTSDQIPVILTHPQSQTVQEGTGSLPFTVTTARSALPLTYQWRFNGVAIQDATNATLVVSDAQLTDLGEYTVVISNGERSVESNPALLDLEVRSGIWPPDPERQFKDKLDVRSDSPLITALGLNDSPPRGVKIVAPPVGSSTTITTSNGGLTQGSSGTLCGRSVGGKLYATVYATTKGTLTFSMSGGLLMQVWLPNWTSTPCVTSSVSCVVPYAGYFSVTIGTSGPASGNVSLRVSFN